MENNTIDLTKELNEIKAKTKKEILEPDKDIKKERLLKQQTSAPTHNPKNFFEQFYLHNDSLYVNIDNNWKSISGNYYTGYTTISSVGQVSITGVGFKPKLVTIKANTSTSSSVGSMDGTNNYSTSQWFDSAGALLGIQTNAHILELKDTSGIVVFSADYYSFDNNGFTLNVTTASTTAYIVYECYS